MKLVSITAAALFTLAAASPGNYQQCHAGTYACTKNPKSGMPGWEVCNTSGKYVYGGDCPPKTVCKFYEASHSPYCVPADYVIH